MDTIKSDEYYQFLNDLAEQISKEKKEKKPINIGVVLDCNEYPAGSAIIWKMQHVSLDDWEKIPLKDVAIAIKEGLNMADFANDYNIKLTKKKVI